MTLDPIALASQLRTLSDADLIAYLAPSSVDVRVARAILIYLVDSGCRVDYDAIPTERGLTSYSLTEVVERWHVERDPHRNLTVISHDAILTVCAVLGIARQSIPDMLGQVRLALLPSQSGSTHVTRNWAEFYPAPRPFDLRGW